MSLILGMIVAAATAAAQSVPAPVDALGWMAGRWEAVDGDRWTEEYWAAPRGGALIGFSRAGRGGALREFEYLRIEPDADGVPVYLAQPGGRPAVAFRLTERDGTSATFVNPAHDFPQRIVYRREGGTMVATVSATDGGNATSWTYRRVP